VPRNIPRFFVALVVISCCSGCFRRQVVEPPPPIESPSPAQETPAPVNSPTPIYIPSKRIETAKLFNGIDVHSTFETEFGATATAERDTPASYQLNVQLKVRVPKANATLSEIRTLNNQLPAVLPGLEDAMSTSQVSPFFDLFYRLKVASLQQNLSRLDALLSRHNFYDCETMLELRNPQNHRRALLIQADMDVDMDGSDGDRVPVMEGSWVNFQPMTSYKWTKATQAPNPFLAAREEKLKALEAAGAVNQEARNALGALRYEISELKKNSFLVSHADPYVALPGSIVGRGGNAPHLGDYCVVIVKDVLYPAIVGDVGPGYKIGEASLRLCQAINPFATANNRPMSELKVTYLVFPGTADKPFAAPDLKKWETRCVALLEEIGGHKGKLFEWKDLTKPSPTPTPSPTPAPSISPTASPTISASPSATISASL
jgi:hypothetical protein